MPFRSQAIDQAADFRVMDKMAQRIWNKQFTLVSGPWDSIGWVTQKEVMK